MIYNSSMTFVLMMFQIGSSWITFSTSTTLKNKKQKNEFIF